MKLYSLFKLINYDGTDLFLDTKLKPTFNRSKNCLSLSLSTYKLLPFSEYQVLRELLSNYFICNVELKIQPEDQSVDYLELRNYLTDIDEKTAAISYILQDDCLCFKQEIDNINEIEQALKLKGFNLNVTIDCQLDLSLEEKKKKKKKKKVLCV